MTTETPPPDKKSPHVIYHTVKEVVEGHLELAELEWTYERKVLGRTLLGLGLGLFCLCLVVFCIQLAAVGLLIRLGAHLELIGLIGVVVNLLLAVIFFKVLTRRKTDMKIPFEKTRSQLRRTIDWIETLI